MKNFWKVTTMFVAAIAPAAVRAQVPRQLPPAVVIDSLANSVTVQNQRKVPVTVYLSTATANRRLGIVAPLSISTLTLPEWMVSGKATVRLLARSEDAGVDLSSDQIKLEPPGRIGMVIPNAEAMIAATDTMSVVVAPGDMAEATITVDNPRDVPVTVFAAKGPFDVRLGQVAARSRETLRFPKGLVSPVAAVTIFIRPRAGLDLATNILQVRLGEHLALRVPVF